MSVKIGVTIMKAIMSKGTKFNVTLGKQTIKAVPGLQDALKGVKNPSIGLKVADAKGLKTIDVSLKSGKEVLIKNTTEINGEHPFVQELLEKMTQKKPLPLLKTVEKVKMQDLDLLRASQKTSFDSFKDLAKTQDSIKTVENLFKKV
ncbi:MAG: hypothetical protein LBK53_00030 [Heliobacteriaceae bacterium]|jgi:hypothetical protein|nr:hypothetical protein [Heliobacteriaceae bacterium]